MVVALRQVLMDKIGSWLRNFVSLINIKEKMRTEYIFWKDGEFWLGYLVDYPDYQTQGMSLEELKANLKDLYDDLNSGQIPNIRKKGELEVA